MNTKRLFLLLALVGTQLISSKAQVQSSFKFDFTAGKPIAGFKKISSADQYSNSKGYGFDFETQMNQEGKPFYFSVSVPEGNYKVTVTLGDSKASLNTVKAESRRLMLEDQRVAAGKVLKKTFVVNVKNKQINATEVVGLKPRELSKLDWDDKLTLEFDKSAALKTLEISKATDQVTVFLAGNSTVVNQDDEPWASWGQMIPVFFKPGIAIANHAESGLTLGSFAGSRRLKKILTVMKPGDYLFIEFGHNDQKEKGPEAGAYASYTERLKLFIKETKNKGGIPVILTSTARRSFQNGKMQHTLGDFPDAARKVAAEEKVALIDLNEMTTRLFNAMGEEESKKAFVHYPANSYPGQDKALADNTHFNTFGAYEIAKCVVEGIRLAKLDLVSYLADPARTFNPDKPDAVADWHWPESLRSSVVKPDGN